MRIGLVVVHPRNWNFRAGSETRKRVAWASTPASDSCSGIPQRVLPHASEQQAQPTSINVNQASAMRACFLVLAVLVSLLVSAEAGYADAMQPNGVTESAQASTGSFSGLDTSAGDKTLGATAITKMKQLMEKAKKEQTSRH